MRPCQQPPCCVSQLLIHLDLLMAALAAARSVMEPLIQLESPGALYVTGLSGVALYLSVHV